ncbi:MAG: methyltransferase domain-containing protein [Chitinophagaceae bacterium]|nr:methyltransferase domain-containing protein [Chitinophagaceae bacterium]
MEKLSSEFWNNRYINKTTQWDLGEVSPPLKKYIDQLEDKNIKILIPGCGNAYEAEYLLKKGFKNITLIDIATDLVQKLKIKFQNNSEIVVIEEDFFNHQITYDLILEQTFFCALDKTFRSKYAQQMSNLLNEDGKLVGLLFNREFETEGPPFGGSEQEYLNYFNPFFEVLTFENCYNSYSKRASTELFMILKKK